MPITKSGWKRMRTSAKSHAVNKDVKSRIMTAHSALDKIFQAGNVAEYDKALSAFFSIIDKAAKHGIIKRNTANRRKSKAMLKRTKLQTKPA